MTLIFALSGINDPDFLSQVSGCSRQEAARWHQRLDGARPLPGGPLGSGTDPEATLDASTRAHWRQRIADALATAPELARRVRVDFLADLPAGPQAAELVTLRIAGAASSELGELRRLAHRAGASTEVVDDALTRRALYLGDATQVLSWCEPYLLQADAPAWALRAAALAQYVCGAVETSLDLYRQLAVVDPEARLVGSTVALLSGRRDIADSLMAGDGSLPATSRGRGLQLLLRGLQTSIEDDPFRSLAHLVQAATALRPLGPELLLPVTPTALAACVAQNSGHAGTVTELLTTAIRDGVGGPVVTSRHRVLEAWSAMTDGRLRAAEAIQASIQEETLPPRDRLPLLALRLGMARRRADTSALDQLWQSTRQHLLEMPVTLELLPSLGEFVVAAARLHDTRAVDLLAEQAEVLLEDLGRPRAWAPMFAWYQMHAAILTDDPERLRVQATLLTSMAGSDPTASVLGHAGQTWLRVLRGTVDRAAVLESVQQLDAVGLAWDASKLAALAAGQTTDRAVMHELMQVARRLQATTGASSSGPARENDGQLTAREWQVAHLVLEGVPYREIGERLFITPKTVEHHVARIRRKLGATSRRDLLGMLRQLAGGDEGPAPGGLR